MAANGTQAETCAVCGRGILKGERTYEYATPAGDIREVCALCRPSAEHAGWVPPGRLETATTVRHERRRGWKPGLAERVRREAARARARVVAREHDRDEPVATEAERPPPAPRPKPRPENPRTAALADFNAGQTPRMITGLSRSLGPPQAEVKPTVDGDGVLITVAWELSWYTWEVTREGIREVAKGAEIDERPGPAPDWNARVEDDGRVTVVDRG